MSSSRIWSRSTATLQVVHGIDFEINDGEFVVLVGPSGCGKSTILRMIAGLETVTGGEIVIDDEVVNDVPPRERDVAMVFQDYALYPHMSVRQNLGFGLRMRGAKTQRDRGGGEADGGDPADREPARPQAEGALRRPAPARRHRPRDRTRAEALPVRRAALQPRRQAPCRHAHADQAAAPDVQDDERLRDPRPGRGDDARRPHRHPAERRHRADRHAVRPLRRAAQHVRGGLHRIAGDEFPEGAARGEAERDCPSCRRVGQA